MSRYQQESRGLKISGVEANITGTGAGFECNAAFTAAAVAGMTNLGSWPLASWIAVTTSAAGGTTLTFTREGLYEVRYAVPIVGAGAPGTWQAGIGYRVTAPQLTANPLPANANIFAAGSFAAVTVEGSSIVGSASIPVSVRDLALAGGAALNLLISNGGDTTPAAGIVAAQVTMWIQQVNDLRG